MSVPRTNPERIRQRLAERGMAFDRSSANWVFVEVICAEFNAVLDELTADPKDPQLLEAASVRLMERCAEAMKEKP